MVKGAFSICAKNRKGEEEASTKVQDCLEFNVNGSRLLAEAFSRGLSRSTIRPCLVNTVKEQPLQSMKVQVLLWSKGLSSTVVESK